MSQGKIIYCVRCLYPTTKPDLLFDGDADGVCNACKNFEKREHINWEEREAEFKKILDRYRSKDGKNYDCVIGVSGGKDSTFQVLKILDYGMNPLCVTATTCMLSAIGRRNIENLKNLGVDYIEATCNPVIRRKMNRIGLEQIGGPSWPELLPNFLNPPALTLQPY